MCKLGSVIGYTWLHHSTQVRPCPNVALVDRVCEPLGSIVGPGRVSDPNQTWKAPEGSDLWVSLGTAPAVAPAVAPAAPTGGSFFQPRNTAQMRGGRAAGACLSRDDLQRSIPVKIKDR